MAGEMERFWDERSRENAAFFVDSRLDYRDPDLERFWAEGAPTLDRLLAETASPPVEPAHTALEIGCGIGRLTRVLAQRAGRVVAIDVSAEMLRRAREANAGLDDVDWLHGDGRSLAGVPDAAVDVAVSHVVFQHIPDPRITLGYVREIGRVLRPGGWAAFQVSNDPAVHRRSPGLRHRLAARAGRAPRGQDHAAWRGSAVELEDLRAAAAEGGCAVATVANPGTQFCLVRLVRG